jgi:hypothetical protein
MPTFDPMTMAQRSELVPHCASRARLWAMLLLSACLNPMPEEFPSEDGSAVQLGPSAGAGAGEATGNDDGAPTVPDRGQGPDFVEGGAGTGGSAPGDVPSPTSPPTGSGGDGELGAPDAGTDAGSFAVDDTGAEAGGEAAP